jgi:hypothetical protein
MDADLKPLDRQLVQNVFYDEINSHFLTPVF